MYHAIYEGKLFNIEEHLNNNFDQKKDINDLKKRADKGAFSCPLCKASLIVKSGDIRGVFFSHSSGESCVLTESYKTYKKQTARESKNHSVMREIVHEVLKNQEKIKPHLHVEFGYIAKAEEKWSQFPDIILQNRGQEIAISILTNVDRSKDSKLTNQIKKRNQYFKEKGLQTLWFIEEQELSLDWDNHVIHLWESEINLAAKTELDHDWDELILELNDKPSDLFDIFGYWRKNENILLNTQSIYYIYSTQEGIDFSVHRFVIDETHFPFRAFALMKGYRMGISSALSFNEKLALSDAEQELIHQKNFRQEYYARKQKSEERYIENGFEVSINEVNQPNTRAATSFGVSSNRRNSGMNYTEFANKLRLKFNMTQQQQLKLWHHYVLKRGAKHFDELWLVAEQLENFEQFEEAINQYLTS